MACSTAIVGSGCGNSVELSSRTAGHLRGLAAIYFDYAAAKGSGPANETELKNHVRNVPSFMLEGTGIAAETADSAFRSERDGEPIVVQYGIAAGEIAGKPGRIVACERKGKDGKCLAVHADGTVVILDESDARAFLLEAGVKE